MLSLFAFGFTELVLAPIQETGRTPQKLYTTAVFPSDTNLESKVNWKIVAVGANTVQKICFLSTLITSLAVFHHFRVRRGVNAP